MLKVLLIIGLFISSIYAEILTSQNPKKTIVLKIESPSNLTLLFKSKRSNCSLAFTIHNDYDELLVSDSHNMRKAKETFNLSLKEGNYYVELSAYSSCYDKQFELNFTKIIGNFEQETNDVITTATPIFESKFYTGYLQKKSKKDLDYYKVDIKKDSKLKLSFKHEVFGNSDFFYIRIFNYENDEIVEYKSILNKRGIEKEIKLAKGVYFIGISAPTFASKINNIKYNIKYLFL